MFGLKSILLSLLLIKTSSFHFNNKFNKCIINRQSRNAIEITNSKEEIGLGDWGNNNDDIDDNNNRKLNHNKGLHGLLPDFEEVFGHLKPSMIEYRECVKKGMNSFINGNLEESLEYFDQAALVNSSQPIAQRSFALYTAERYNDAIIQLKNDIELIEDMKLFKATDLRLLLSACYNKINDKESARKCVDAYDEDPNGISEDRGLWKDLLLFYSGDDGKLSDLMETIGGYGENELNSGLFFGNFYIGIYFDSINQPEMAVPFLEIPKESTRFKQDDMWYHLPRMLFQHRGY